MNLVVFASPEEQATGLLRYDRVPSGALFLFPNVSSRILTTVGLRDPIRAVFLSQARLPLRVGLGLEVLIPPNSTIQIPPETRHVVESSQKTPILPRLGLVRQRLAQE